MYEDSLVHIGDPIDQPLLAAKVRRLNVCLCVFGEWRGQFAAGVFRGKRFLSVWFVGLG